MSAMKWALEDALNCQTNRQLLSACGAMTWKEKMSDN